MLYRFSPSGSTIRITVAPNYHDPEADEGGSNAESTVCFSVCDQGSGIPVEQQDKVFERFTQASHNNAKAKGGTGLGLTICRNIVEQHGGKIWVDSAVDEGSCFYFTMPVDE